MQAAAVQVGTRRTFSKGSWVDPDSEEFSPQVVDAIELFFLPERVRRRPSIAYSKSKVTSIRSLPKERLVCINKTLSHTIPTKSECVVTAKVHLTTLFSSGKNSRKTSSPAPARRPRTLPCCTWSRGCSLRVRNV